MSRRRPTLSGAGGADVDVDEISESFSLLDVVYANQFEGEFIGQTTVEETEENFYRGAPPKWLNFHISKLAEADGTGSPFIKRDGYNRLVKLINKRRKGPGTSTLKLFHQQGCGGTTLAMQVLWDLRKTFRCAALTGSTLNITKVAKEVVHLFTAGDQYSLNTVLLLVNDEFILDHLQDAIMEEIGEHQLDIDMPVVIVLNCVRSDHVVLEKETLYKEKEEYQIKDVILKKTISDTEKQLFDAKKEELNRKYGDKVKQFHGFNILHTNFSPDYVEEACAIFNKMDRKNKPLKTRLAAFLSLLNAYVPGSYLLETQCLDFLTQGNPIYDDRSLDDQMQPFSHLVITFQRDRRCERKVCMAHPMIAKFCTELMAAAGVTRSDTARNFLTSFCSDDVPHCLLGFVKDMLTKREKIQVKRPDGAQEHREKRRTEHDNLEKFSKLILHITKMEDKKQSVSVLKVASNIFPSNALFPQALARFCYGELEDYKEAETWAQRAMERDPKKSFIADTLGQVHKHHLKNKDLRAEPREMLQLAQKAIEAFEDEEQLAESEHKKNMTEDEKAKVLRSLNIRGHFGFLQVCNILFNQLVGQNETWRRVLTGNVSLGSVLHSLGDNKVFRFNGLISHLREKVEKKFEFLDTFLTFSQSVMKKDMAYVSAEAAECYKKYVGDSAPKNKDKFEDILQKLKEKLAVTSAGVLSCLDRSFPAEVKLIAGWWEEMCQSKNVSTQALVNSILAKIMLKNMNMTTCSSDLHTTLRQKKPLSSDMQTEYHMLALLVFWPTDDDDRPSDLHQLIRQVKHSFDHDYQTILRSRYLRPVFFIGPGRGLNRFVHRRKIEIFWTKDALLDSDTNWRDENIFKDPTVQNNLVKLEGVVRNYRLYATFGGTEIELEANRRDGLWKSGDVSFYLGFTINGPVAFSIEKRLQITAGPPEKLKLETSDCDMDSCRWTKLEPEVRRLDGIKTYSLQSHGGSFECGVSSLRWVCQEPISFSYQFCSWENHREKPACIGYMPAGPLMDISLTAGKPEEVYLPHWIDTESATSDMFTVLHVDACGDSVQQVSELTPRHVKLVRPTFSPNGVMFRMKLGIPVKVYHDVLIFKTKKEFLTLHLYLVPPDPDLQEKVVIGESSYGSIRIPKPNPEKSLQILEDFLLKSDADVAEISPEKMKLRYKRRTYFEVFLRNVDGDFKLQLQTQNKDRVEEIVWTCTLRKAMQPLH
ncbi:sterile alpha motif domain-containing protein 9-like [Cololabis saira]|uniref:sterile alpha motif domain-containing protein 9-like n=1 Tax=Cololabis saira TaxID=129043 RepID=UPI002AD25C9A|nr:sterile alpha motif domain-containing protein 9-like [Cololabis saira]